ncbi:MAG: putative DNA modification/repair radical SAM protein [Muribaculaceae bacterium]|nr:putative DNA modification/repair radical SAM protein [Muribaculaceae bacterium]MCM1478423.1 putative DNA modification/repair radical SAM protein [Muribaculaceae bacterium]
MFEKLKILGESAKYDASCTSSGVSRRGGDGLGNASYGGLCHSFAADGRCISLLKILMTNFCLFDCKYCVNRRSNDVPRARFTPDEIAELTINFYRRNYIEGLFLSSGIIQSPDYTCEQMIEAISILRNKYQFKGYIHAKAIPGADPELINRLGTLADRISVNIELPSQKSLNALAPDKSKSSILLPMGHITNKIQQNSYEIVKYKSAPKFAPAGQSTQMIIGATPDTDFQILRLSEAMYGKYRLKRVFYSAYIPVGDQKVLPPAGTKPPLLREHRLYQADWLLRFYGFKAEEILDEQHQQFNPLLDPKCNWALHHPEQFPVEVNKAPYEQLLRVPGIGVKSAQRITAARRQSKLDFPDLGKLGVVLKRAVYFILCGGKRAEGLIITQAGVMRQLMSASTVKELEEKGNFGEQLSFFEDRKASEGVLPSMEDAVKCLTGEM